MLLPTPREHYLFKIVKIVSKVHAYLPSVPLKNLDSYLEEFVMIQFDPVLEPGDFWSRKAQSHTEECDLPSKHVIHLEVRRFRDFRTLKFTPYNIPLFNIRTGTCTRSETR